MRYLLLVHLLLSATFSNARPLSSPLASGLGATVVGGLVGAAVSNTTIMNQIAKKMKAKTPTQIKVTRTAVSVIGGAIGGGSVTTLAHFAFDPIKKWYNLKKWARKRPQPGDEDYSEESEESKEVLVVQDHETNEDDDIESEDEPETYIIPNEVLKTLSGDVDTPIEERKTPVVDPKISLRKDGILDDNAYTFLMPVVGEIEVPTSRADGVPHDVAAKLGLE